MHRRCRVRTDPEHTPHNWESPVAAGELRARNRRYAVSTVQTKRSDTWRGCQDDHVDDHFRRVTNRLLGVLDGYLSGDETIETLQGEASTAAGALDNQHRQVKQQLERLGPALEEIRFLGPVDQQKAMVAECVADLRAAIAGEE
jgi:hypothetical protein